MAASVLLAGLAAAQQPPTPEPSSPPPEELVTRAVTLRHQPVREAVGLVFPLLSEWGSVEVSPGGNTLVVRDLPEALGRILPLLEDFDQPSREIELAIRIVSAGVDDRDGAGEDLGLPEELVRRLKELLRYRSYRRVAGADLKVREGRDVEGDLGGLYRVEFRMGRLEAGGRIKLLGFRIHRRDREPTAPPLIHTNINLRLDKPMVLGLARTESSERALMVVLSCRPAPTDAEDG
ncbi:MAG: hypothetical protein R3325_01545 [Thermoanaerobaculia bacterium]|nr:hypothetical protein [Thermoanaerobaculia bacterium]